MPACAALLCVFVGMVVVAPPEVRADSCSLGTIMPLGDSITMGYPVEGGYRDPLCVLLSNSGYDFSFVGSSTENASSALVRAGQASHEGHGGYFIRGDLDSPPIANGIAASGLYEHLGDWIGPGAATPDAILLMIGTNDIYHNYCRATASERLKDLIDRIYDYRPDVSLFVASIPPMTDPIKNAYAATYNTAIPDIAGCQRRSGRDVRFVDMYRAIATSDLYADGVHLAAGGDRKMARAWYDALTMDVPEPCSLWLAISGLSGIMGYAWRSLQ